MKDRETAENPPRQEGESVLGDVARLQEEVRKTNEILSPLLALPAALQDRMGSDRRVNKGTAGMLDLTAKIGNKLKLDQQNLEQLIEKIEERLSRLSEIENSLKTSVVQLREPRKSAERMPLLQVIVVAVIAAVAVLNVVPFVDWFLNSRAVPSPNSQG